MLAAHEDDGRDVGHLRCAHCVGVDQPGEQQGARLGEGQDITHEIRRTGAHDLHVEVGLLGDQLPFQNRDYLTEFH